MVIASVGWYSGIFASSTVPMLKGLQAWVAHINERGGLNGHRVQLAVYDDGGDTARNRAARQDAIERRGAIAFLLDTNPLSGKGGVEYAVQKRVPILGGTGGEPWAYSEAMVFPQMSSAMNFWATYPSSAARHVIPQGKRKVGTVVCAEGQACADSATVWAERAKDLGFEVVYKSRPAAAQPDFTAECLAARNAGVEVQWIVLPANAAGNFVNSCARQSFKPTYVFPIQAVGVFMEDELYDGSLAPNPVFPWSQKGTPATDEFQEAFRKYLADKAIPYAAPIGWVAGKMLEKAAANLPEPPTTAGLLAGLWTFREETLGGLTSPLTFIENQTAKPTVCWFDVVNVKGKWTSPAGGQSQCA